MKFCKLAPTLRSCSVLGVLLPVGLLAGCLSTAVVQAADWIPIKTRQEVKIYSHTPPGRDYRRLRGEVTVEAKPGKVVRILQDLERTPEWHLHTTRVEELELVDMTTAIVHIHSRPPWPVKPRDVVARVSLTLLKATGAIRIDMKSVDDVLPSQPGFIRTARLDAEWLITPESEDSSRVRYTLYVEPGGSIPRWIFNNVSMDVPLFSLIHLRELISRKD